MLDRVAENVVSRSGCAVRLMIEIYAFNRVPTPGVTVSVDEYLELKLEPSTRTFMAEVLGSNTLVRFNNCSSIRDVAERLQTERGLQFFWVDFHIEIHLAYGSRRPVLGALRKSGRIHWRPGDPGSSDARALTFRFRPIAKGDG